MSDQPKKEYRPRAILPDPWSPQENWEATKGHIIAQEGGEDKFVLPPDTVWTTRRKDDVLYIAGEGPVDGCDLMIIQMAPNEDNAEEGMTSRYGGNVQSRPSYMRGPVASIIRNAMSTSGISPEAVYFTSFVKWLLPREHRKKPKRHEIEWARAAFAAEVKRVKPKAIVCMGKPVFDLLYQKHKFKMDEIAGGWFDAVVEGHECKLYPMENPEIALLKPDYIEKMRLDFREVASSLNQIRTGVEKTPTDYRYIRNSAELDAWIDEMDAGDFKVYAHDSEWGGLNHVKGRLRTSQFSWGPGKCAVIRFCDPSTRPEDLPTYAFDIPYKEVGNRLKRIFYKPGVKFIGHLLAADLVWLKSWLGIEYIGRCGFDTLFAQNCIDEYQDGKLERMCVLRTDMGRYDIELQIWKKDNKLQDDEGYGRVPDDILLPYAARDGDGTFRLYLQLNGELLKQGIGLYRYYYNDFLPFVTEGFAGFTLNGLPCDRQIMDELRELYQWSYEWQRKKFLEIMVREAWVSMMSFVDACVKDHADDATYALSAATAKERILQLRDSDDALGICEYLKEIAGPENVERAVAHYEHWIIAPSFNIRSGIHMRRWLFDVKGFIPLRSTGNKEQGRPAMAWSKVMAFPPERRKDIVPSYDKNTLKVYAFKDNTVLSLLQLNMVGNVTKGFLRPADLDADGEMVRENGLHFWLSNEDTVHPLFSATESARPRAFNPNCLNWSSQVNDFVKKGIAKAIEQADKEGLLPEKFRRYTYEPITSIRGVVVPKGDWFNTCRLAREVELARKKLDEMRNEVKADPSNTKNLVKLGQLAAASAALDVKWDARVAWMADPNNPLEIIVESDLQTAEVRGLAYISGDPKMIAAVNDPDTQFAIWKKDPEKVVRLHYSDECGYDEKLRDKAYIMHLVSEPFPITDLVDKNTLPAGVDINDHAREVFEAKKVSQNLHMTDMKGWIVKLTPATDADFLKTDDGKLVHPRRDLHWELAESTYKLPREAMRKKVQRAGGKVGNFQSAYGASGPSLERAIEVETGEKPEDGTGDKLLEALNDRYSVAQAFLRSCEEYPKIGKMTAYSGRIRHFYSHDDESDDIPERLRESALSGPAREARNFNLQHSVASVMGLAHMKMEQHIRESDIRAVALALLYDSEVHRCHIEDRFLVSAMHKRFIFDETKEEYHGRTLRYPIDTEINVAWSGRPPKILQKLLDDPAWRVRRPKTAA